MLEDSVSECIKTGADVYLVDYGAVAHCDLFKLDYGGFVIHYAGEFNYNPEAQDDTEIDLIVSDIELHLQPAKVIFVNNDDAVLTKRLKDYIGD